MALAVTTISPKTAIVRIREIFLIILIAVFVAWVAPDAPLAA